MNIRPLKTRQNGLSLVELMIAITVGLFLTVIISQIFVGSKQSYRINDDLSRLQENGRFATELLSRTIRLAGFKSDATLDSNKIFPAGGADAVIGSNNDGVNSSDSITVRFYQDSGTGVTNEPPSLIDCQGTLIAAGITSINRFYIANGANGAPSLFCDTTTTGANAREMVSDVEAMQILYGVDTDSDMAVNYYVNAASVTTWSQVISARIAMVIRTANLINPTNDTKTYNLLGTTFDPVDDKRSRRFFEITINLRNRTS